jgi:hypothetical protein
MDVMFSDYRHWLEYDSVALAVLLAGIGFVELIVPRRVPQPDFSGRVWRSIGIRPRHFGSLPPRSNYNQITTGGPPFMIPPGRSLEARVDAIADAMGERVAERLIAVFRELPNTPIYSPTQVKLQPDYNRRPAFHDSAGALARGTG